MHKINLVINRPLFNQVVFNLLINTVKYAKKDPDDFKLRIEVDYRSRSGFYVINFMDWGIGIEKGFEEKIFNEGVRAPKAMVLNVNGNGYGLTISKRVMKELGGDLVLTKNANPTIFSIILPKVTT